MSAVEKLSAVIASDVLLPDLTIVPCRGATTEEIREEEERLGVALCKDYVAILQHWNGFLLEVFRLFGCGEQASRIGRISSVQLPCQPPLEGAIAIGSDPSGFVYFQSRDGRIFSLDTDGGDLVQVANDLDSFIDNNVFGPGAAEFAGDDWLEELQAAGIVP